MMKEKPTLISHMFASIYIYDLWTNEHAVNNGPPAAVAAELLRLKRPRASDHLPGLHNWFRGLPVNTRR